MSKKKQQQTNKDADTRGGCAAWLSGQCHGAPCVCFPAPTPPPAPKPGGGR